MSASPKTLTSEIGPRVIRIQVLTLIWMTVEAAVSLGAAWAARSPALLGFGGDSAIELLSAAVVLSRFYHRSTDHAEERAAKIGGALLFVLAGFVIIASALALLGHAEPRPSLIGIALLILAAVAMPWLARQKRRLSAATGSAVLRADAAESATCGYLALIALAGLVVNAIWGVRWADPVAALTLLPLIAQEGIEAMKGKSCRDAYLAVTLKQGAMRIDMLTQSRVPPVELTLPSGKSVAIPRCSYLFSEWRGAPILDTYGGKALLNSDGKPVFAELAILGVLERAGWDGVWVDTYRRKFRRSMPPESSKLPPHALELYERICRANGGKASGCFDVFAWKDGEYVFVESKRKSKDSIQRTQKAWVEAALATGIELGSLLICEWDLK
jgi:protein-S-isoprenylcysteine O-methyltransferase Ste14